MTEHHGPERPERPSTQRSSERSTTWWAVVAPAAALLVGILIGGVVVGVADDDAPAADPQPTSSPTAGDVTESPGEGPMTVVVPEECLAAVDTVEEATALTREGAGAIRNFQPQKLRSLLTRLEELDRRAREQAQACRGVQVDR